MKQNEPKKRNYVKRKRSLSESTKIILSTLQVINSSSPNPLDNNELTRIAINHAKAIEATCWSRRAKFSDEIFQTIIRSKTTELCQTLLSSSFSGMLVLSKGSEPALPIPPSSSSSIPSRNHFLSTNQQNNNIQFQQHYLLSSPNDSPSTSPNSNSIDCGSNISENKNNNPLFQYSLIPNYPLPPLDAQISQSGISSNILIETSSVLPHAQQTHLKQPLYQINHSQPLNKSYIISNLTTSDLQSNAKEQLYPNRLNSDTVSKSKIINLSKQPNFDEENNSDCWHKATPKIKFPSISSLLS